MTAIDNDAMPASEAGQPFRCSWAGMSQIWWIEADGPAGRRMAGAGGEATLQLLPGLTVTADRLSGKPLRLLVHARQVDHPLLPLLLAPAVERDAARQAAGIETARRMRLHEDLVLSGRPALAAVGRLALLADTPAGRSGAGVMELEGLALLDPVRQALPDTAERFQARALILLQASPLPGRTESTEPAHLLPGLPGLLARAGSAGRAVLVDIARLTGARELVTPWLEWLPVSLEPLHAMAADGDLADVLRQVEADYETRPAQLAAGRRRAGAQTDTYRRDVEAVALAATLELHLVAPRALRLRVGVVERADLNAIPRVWEEQRLLAGSIGRVLLVLPEGHEIADPVAVMQDPLTSPDPTGAWSAVPLAAQDGHEIGPAGVLVGMFATEVAVQVGCMEARGVSRSVHVRLVDDGGEPALAVAGGHTLLPAGSTEGQQLRLRLPYPVRLEQLRVQPREGSDVAVPDDESSGSLAVEHLRQLQRQACQWSRRAAAGESQDASCGEAAARTWLRVVKTAETLHGLGNLSDRELVQALQRAAMACANTTGVVLPRRLEALLERLQGQPALAAAAAEERQRHPDRPVLGDFDDGWE